MSMCISCEMSSSGKCHPCGHREDLKSRLTREEELSNGRTTAARCFADSAEFYGISAKEAVAGLLETIEYLLKQRGADR